MVNNNTGKNVVPYSVPVNILMHPNGLYAFVANSNANKVEVIDMKKFYNCKL
jgi:DNA-binding beta-propeller fold protein YncE